MLHVEEIISIGYVKIGVVNVKSARLNDATLSRLFWSDEAGYVYSRCFWILRWTSSVYSWLGRRCALWRIFMLYFLGRRFRTRAFRSKDNYWVSGRNGWEAAGVPFGVVSAEVGKILRIVMRSIVRRSISSRHVEDWYK
jgi:hypothetical protein